MGIDHVDHIGISHFTEYKRERFEKSRFMSTMEITIHEGKNGHFTFHGK